MMDRRFISQYTLIAAECLHTLTSALSHLSVLEDGNENCIPFSPRLIIPNLHTSRPGQQPSTLRKIAIVECNGKQPGCSVITEMDAQLDMLLE